MRIASIDSTLLMQEISLMRDQVKSHLADLNALENTIVIATGAVWALYAGGSLKNEVQILFVGALPLAILAVGFARFLGLSKNIIFIDFYTTSLERSVFGDGRGWTQSYHDNEFRKSAIDYYKSQENNTISLYFLRALTIGISRQIFWLTFLILDLLFLFVVICQLAHAK